MADWHAVYESWDAIPDENKELIVKLMREKPKEKLAELFSREPYAEKVYEKVVGKWQPPLPTPKPIIQPAVPATPPPTERAPQKEAAVPVAAAAAPIGVTERITPRSAVPATVGGVGAVFLPVISLITLLSAEIAYYSSGSVGFLDGALPFSLKTWLILLVLALAFGLASGFSIFRLLKQGKALSKGSGVNIQHGMSIAAATFNPLFKLKGKSQLSTPAACLSMEWK